MTYNNDANNSLQSLILSGIMNVLKDTHTILIGEIIKVNAKTIDVQPVIARNVKGKDEPLPVFPEVPVINLLGGTSSIQMPLAIGDSCVLFVSERCFDGWYYGNKNQKPMHPRMFDYSDAIALVGLKNQAGELEIPDRIKMVGDTLQIGDYEHQGNREQTGNYTLTGDFTINGHTIKNGNLTVNGNITIVGNGSGTVNASGCTVNLTGGDVVADGISLKNHTHGGVQAGGGNTGVPN